ncbi:MAG: hypothetical protein IPN59_13075 [Holophaga sp.]|nr:hypothetical protein [Holophaga sp.]
MPRQLFIAADIRRLASEQKSKLLILSPEDIVTPEAVDTARELGVRLEYEKPLQPGTALPQPASPNPRPVRLHHCRR